jgi:hypothetical protein
MFSQPLSWADANSMCATQGQNGALASYRNAGEFNSLLSLTTSNAYTWIGANSIGRAKYDYIFIRGGVSGLSGANAGSGQWCSAQPDDAGNDEKCINILQLSQFGYNCLNDYPCNLATPYICEIDMTLSVCDSKWHHVAFTHGDGSTTNSKTYVDGALVSTTSQTLTIQTDGSASLVIGSIPLSVSGTYSFTGSPGVSTCPAGVSSFVSSSLPCAPISGPTDTSFYFSCDEAEGTGAYSVTNPAGITFVADRFGTPGRALQLNNAYFATPVSMPLSVGNAARSITMFVVCSTGYGFTPLISWGSEGKGTGMVFATDQSMMRWSFWLMDINYNGVCDNLWHHWAATYDGSKVVLYLDGNLMSTTSISETVNTASGTTLKIGASPLTTYGDRCKNTRFDDIRIYNRVLLAAEIANIYYSASIQSPFAGSLFDIRLYNHALTSSEVLTLSQPILPTFANANNPSRVAGATSYTWYCASGYFGPSATLNPSSDGVWSQLSNKINCQPCVGSTYSYGGSSCSSCPTGATIVTGNARGCTPSSTLTPGPSDSLVFYLSGTSTEGVSAFPNAPTVSYVTSPFGDVNGALTLSSGSSLSLTPSVGSGLLSVLPSGNSAWSASAWVKCAAQMSDISTSSATLLSWGISSSSSSAALSVAPSSLIKTCDGKWHHLAVTREEGATAATISYFDGNSAVLPASPWAIYTFANGGQDESGNNRNCLVQGSAPTSPTTGLQITAQSHGVLFSPSLATTSFTLSLGYKMAYFSGTWHSLATCGQAGYVHMNLQTGTGELGLFNNGFFGIGFIPTPGVLTYFTVVGQGTEWSWYINGVFVKKLSTGFNNAERPLEYLGSPSLPWTNAPFGFISDVVVYNRALSSAEVQQIYTWQRTNIKLSVTTLLSFCQFNAQSATACATPFSGSLSEFRLYNRALTSSEVLTLSQPPFTALGAAANAVLSTTSSSVATSYDFFCASNTRGNGGTFTQSSIDRSWYWSPRPLCDYCPPGTYLPAGAFSCSLCPSGFYGNRAGLTSPTCSGPCPIPSECPAGTAYLPSSLSTLSCASGGARAIPSTLGMRLWPAAHPANPQKVDLIVAPLSVCESHTHQSCLQSSSVSMGGVTLYTVGTASDLHMEPADDLTCLVQ